MRIRERFNPRAPCGARRHGCRYGQPDRTISTHAPLAGRDIHTNNQKHHGEISTHAPLAGRDGRARWYTIPKSVFQPTRPLRGATSSTQLIQLPFEISTHAPLAGRD